jgi:hypothetical protein
LARTLNEEMSKDSGSIIMSIGFAKISQRFRSAMNELLRSRNPTTVRCFLGTHRAARRARRR